MHREIANWRASVNSVSEVTERAMRGELDFSASLAARRSRLRMPMPAFCNRCVKPLPLMPGLTVMVQRLQEAGWHVAIASGGFTYYAEYLRDKLIWWMWPPTS